MPELDRVTQATRLDQVPDTVRSPVTLFTDEPPEDDVTVEVHSVLPQDLQHHVDTARQRRRGAAGLQEAARSANLATAATLQKAGFPLRDIGALLDITYQRAQ